MRFKMSLDNTKCSLGEKSHWLRITDPEELQDSGAEPKRKDCGRRLGRNLQGGGGGRERVLQEPEECFEYLVIILSNLRSGHFLLKAIYRLPITSRIKCQLLPVASIRATAQFII